MPIGNRVLVSKLSVCNSAWELYRHPGTDSHIYALTFTEIQIKVPIAEITNSSGSRKVVRKS